MKIKINGNRLYLLLALFLLCLGILMAVSPKAKATPFTMCPDGHEGIVGEHTSCAFAENVRKEFFLLQPVYRARQFTAYSPVTGQSYAMTCGAITTASFIDGAVVNAIPCYGGTAAEVVIW